MPIPFGSCGPRRPSPAPEPEGWIAGVLWVVAFTAAGAGAMFVVAKILGAQ